MEILPLEFVNLPITVTVTDWDEQQKLKAREEKSTKDAENAGTTTASSSPVSEEKEDKVLIDEITDAAEDVWNRLSSVMKSKVRDACIEVLRRTDTHSSQGESQFEYDDDARFLD